MRIGDEILIRAKIVDFDANPHGASTKVEVEGFVDRDTLHILNLQQNKSGMEKDPLQFWIHRVDSDKVIVYRGKEQ
jgi:hypothetical protein